MCYCRKFCENNCPWHFLGSLHFTVLCCPGILWRSPTTASTWFETEVLWSELHRGWVQKSQPRGGFSSGLFTFNLIFIWHTCIAYQSTRQLCAGTGYDQHICSKWCLNWGKSTGGINWTIDCHQTGCHWLSPENETVFVEIGVCAQDKFVGLWSLQCCNDEIHNLIWKCQICSFQPYLLLRARLEAERNSFMLYLRGEVFIRAALVKVNPWNWKWNHGHLLYLILHTNPWWLICLWCVLHLKWLLSRWKEQWWVILRQRWGSLKCATPRENLWRWKSAPFLSLQQKDMDNEKIKNKDISIKGKPRKVQVVSMFMSILVMATYMVKIVNMKHRWPST